MKVYLLAIIWAIFVLPVSGLSRADTIMGRLSLEEKVDMLFVVPQGRMHKDSVKVGNTSYVDYAVFDTRPGDPNCSYLPLPSQQTVLSLRDQRLKKRLTNGALQYYIEKGYDGVVVPDISIGLSRIYIGNDAVEIDNYIQVMVFPCDLFNNLIANVDANADDRLYEEASFFNHVKLPSLNIWQNKVDYGISFNDILDHDILFWDTNEVNCRQQLINAFKYGPLDEHILDKRIERLLNYEVQMTSQVEKEALMQTQIKDRYSAFKSSISIYQRSRMLPIRRVDTLSASITDRRRNVDDVFYNKASYYQPNIKQKNKAAYLQITLCDNEYALRYDLRRKRQPFTSKKHFNVLVYAGSLSKRMMEQLGVYDAVVIMPEKIKDSWSLLAQAIYGGIEVNGKHVFEEVLSKQKLYAVDASKNRLGFNPVIINQFYADSIAKIDSIVNDAIKQKATPGAQLLVVKSGDIVLQRSYGYHTYQKKQKVINSDLYDVASITKLAVTFPMVMQLYEEQVLNLDATLGNYLAEIDTTDKVNITIRELLLHQSGLASFIPFYNRALDRESLRKRSLYSRHYSRLYNIRVDTRLYQNRHAAFRTDVFSDKQTGAFQRRVTQSMFMNNTFVDSMYNYIYASRLSEEKKYRYSDLGYYLVQKIIEQEEKEDLETLYYTRFTDLMGASKMVYNPLQLYKPNQIVPTEDDQSFRKTLLDGYVHDQGAAMLGGVAAHAGLFANAGDLAKMGQMFLNEGQYGGIRFVNSKTIGKFTQTVNHGNRRGLGVDKPDENPERNNHVSHMASLSSYGHTGFTGTILWIDPEHDLIYIFLSNRIFPHAYNKKLIEMNVRTKIQDVVYNSVVKS